MANPLPFAPISNDTVDWVKAVTPVSVSGSGTTTPATGIQPNNGGTITTSISTATTNVNLTINDGLQHYLSAVQIDLVMTAFSGTPPWVGRLLVSTGPPAADICQCRIGIQSFPSAGQLPQSTVTMVYPFGFFIPVQTLGTFQLRYDFFVDTGSGSFTVSASIGTYFI